MAIKQFKTEKGAAKYADKLSKDADFVKSGLEFFVSINSNFRYVVIMRNPSNGCWAVCS